MADTIRSLAELNQQFADNTTGIIAPQDIRDLMVSQMVYGEIGSGAKTAITIGTTYTIMDLTVAGVVGRGLTADTTNKRVSGIPVDMKVEVWVDVTFTGTNGRTYDVAVFRNGAQENRLTDSDTFLTGVICGVKMGASLQAAAGDFFDLRVKASSNSSSFTLLRARLYVKRIGVE